MASIDELIAKHTEGISPVQLDYSDVLPNAQLIAVACEADEVRQLLARIERLAQEREDADLNGTINGDDLDFMWRKFARYASLLPHLVPRFLPIVAEGLDSRRSELRLYVAQALVLSPTVDAIEPLEACLAGEETKPVRRLLEEALVKCKAKQSWVKRLLQ